MLNRVAFLFVKDVLDLWYIGYFLILVAERFWKRQEDEANQRRRSETIADSLVNSETIETEELNERAEKVDKPEDTANIVNECEEILRTKRKDIITVVYHHRKVFSRFRGKEKFMTLMSKFKIHKNTIVFKINVF